MDLLPPRVVKLYSRVIATGADHPNWLDDSTTADENRPPSDDNGRNMGIYGWSRQGVGKHKIVLQDKYYSLMSVHAFCGDESTTDDKAVGFTVSAEDVDATAAPTISGATVTGPYVELTFYDDAGNAQEITDGNHIWVELTLLNQRA